MLLILKRTISQVLTSGVWIRSATKLWNRRE